MLENAFRGRESEEEMTLAGDVKTILTGSTALMAKLLGGVHEALEISRQLTPTAFDANGEIKPCALVKSGSELRRGPHDEGVQTVVTVYLYERSGSSSIDAAELLVYGLLNKKKIGSRTWEMVFETTQYSLLDTGLDCSLVYSRYTAMRRKV
jgi:hypothetical protein